MFSEDNLKKKKHKKHSHNVACFFSDALVQKQKVINKFFENTHANGKVFCDENKIMYILYFYISIIYTFLLFTYSN